MRLWCAKSPKSRRPEQHYTPKNWFISVCAVRRHWASKFSYSRNLQLPAEQAKLFHVVSQTEFKEQIKAGRFATVQSCKDDLIDYYELPSVFPNQADVEDCSVFWGKVKTAK